MNLKVIFPLLILLVFTYVIFIFPFEILASWFGYSRSLIEPIISTFIIYFICLYYFRSKSSNKIIKFLVYEGVGIGSVSLFVIIPILFFDFFINLSDQLKLNIFFLFQIPLLLYGFWNARRLSIKNLKFEHELLKEELLFVFISDVHIGSNHPNTLKKIVSNINEIKPNFLLIGGDLYDSSDFQINDLSYLKDVKCPTYLVTGNHEYYLKNYQSHLDKLNKIGVSLIENKSIIVKGINLIGINDNLSIIEKKNFFYQLYKKEYFNLLAVHQPSLWKHIKSDVNLMMSGHTHNGQIFPFNFLVKLKFPEIYGLYSKNTNRLYVSSGAATWGPKIRIGSKNELIKVHLVKTNNS